MKFNKSILFWIKKRKKEIKKSKIKNKKIKKEKKLINELKKLYLQGIAID